MQDRFQMNDSAHVYGIEGTCDPAQLAEVFLNSLWTTVELYGFGYTILFIYLFLASNYNK